MKNSIDEWIINNNTISYNNDGLILTPLDGSREIKIKPKKLYTIDLLYINNKWIDRDNTEWNVNNKLISNELVNNTIWRCYYEDVGLVAKEIRHDKTKPNTNKVAVLINGLYYTEYKYIKYDNIYRDLNIVDSYWTSIVKNNTNIIKRMISNISTLRTNPNIIDFGCGSGRTLLHLNNYIKDYTYIGLDKDINMICKAINKYSINNNIMFSYKDIARSAENNWVNLEKNNFDIVLMINSLMHFSTDYFWKELELITKSSSLLLFNLVSMENNEYYKLTDCDKYFMERKDNTIYYQFPIHENIKEEPYIDINDILKRGYKIVECYQSKENNLSKYYKWYILERSCKTN
jgi:SAM-dependent methyltransferase